MKSRVPLTLMQNRIREGDYGSDDSYGMVGAFRLIAPGGALLLALSSGSGRHAEGWEHVSVSAEKRCPTWDEMCFVKDVFWEPHEMAVQYHPPASEYVNHHPWTLHIWKPIDMVIPMPPSLLVGPKSR